MLCLVAAVGRRMQCKITSLCVQRLRFVPPWLTDRQMSIHTHFDKLIWKAQTAELKTVQYIYFLKT